MDPFGGPVALLRLFGGQNHQNGGADHQEKRLLFFWLVWLGARLDLRGRKASGQMGFEACLPPAHRPRGGLWKQHGFNCRSPKRPTASIEQGERSGLSERPTGVSGCWITAHRGFSAAAISRIVLRCIGSRGK